MIQDLHSHTYYSFCGKSTPDELIHTAIEGGIDMLGICDHNYGIIHGRKCVLRSECDDLFEKEERTLLRYFDHMHLLKEKYAEKIDIRCGIEIATIHKKRHPLPPDADISFFDFCLVEHLDEEDSITNGDIFSFAERCQCPVGIAHTDMFALLYKKGTNALSYFTQMAQKGIFWEMNVNFDSIHKYREHAYVKRFLSNKEEQEIIKKSGISLSVGFDGHDVRDYVPERIKRACAAITALGIPLAFEK